jgi:hypothetical protein
VARRTFTEPGGLHGAALLLRLDARRAVAAPGVGAHPDHRDGDLHIDVVVGHTAGRVDVIVRRPLELFEGVGLPLAGRNYVDVAAFREPDPIVGDRRTYVSERTRSAPDDRRLDRADRLAHGACEEVARLARKV